MNGVSVAVPTIGRPDLLAKGLASVRACQPAPAEVVVIDQSGDRSVARVVGDHGARLVRDRGVGYARALNTALQACAGDIVLVTNDDCTVASDWVGVAWQQHLRYPGAIATGQVRPAGVRGGVPSVKVQTDPEDFTGRAAYNVLYGGNMALPRCDVLDAGGFDERPGMRIAAEDNDLCWRWLCAGRALRYVPELVVWHHDWRTPSELRRRYVQYGYGHGVFLAKHLRAGDREITRLLRSDLRYWLRAAAAAAAHGRRDDQSLGMLRGLPAGLVTGWRQDRRLWRDTPRQAAYWEPRTGPPPR